MTVNNNIALNRIGFAAKKEEVKEVKEVKEVEETAPVDQKPIEIEEPEDSFSTNKSSKSEAEAPDISGTRLFFSRLTNDQIKQVNESRKLPDNAKFMRDGYGAYALRPNWFGITVGTKTLPAGFELKKTSPFGFTTVVPNDSEGLFIKNAK